jgi:DNA modification methylase
MKLDDVALLIPIDQVAFVKELYPRHREDDAVIEQYRASLDLLPPIKVARERILVDGLHRLQAFRREGATEIPAINLGNLTDIEILKESIRCNATHGRQLDTKDKRRMADQLYRQGIRDDSEFAELLSITPKTLKEYLRDAKRDEKEEKKGKAWDLWLDCCSERDIADRIGAAPNTIGTWIAQKSNGLENCAPASRQHFDVWSFPDGDDGSYFGHMPPQVVENLLWGFTEPGEIVFDPFAGSGTTIDIAKAMGRRVWASDINPSTPNLPIHKHDIVTGWPADAPGAVHLILLDPPYWQQAKAKYSQNSDDLANMPLEDSYGSWDTVIKVCQRHLIDGGKLAYIISPTQCGDGKVIDHATEMLWICKKHDLQVERRFIVPYQTQQATGQQVTWARDNKRWLKLYRDLVVLSR